MVSQVSVTPSSYEGFLGTRRFPALDGVRAVAILLVATAHPAYPEVWPRLHGTTGVSLFFVLSGFLITTLCLREESTPAGFDIGSFYIRRIFRIYPVFFSVLTLYVLLIVVLGFEPDRRQLFLDNLSWTLLMMPEHGTFFNSSDLSVPFDGSWSLGIEEKFYLVWPVLAFVLLRGRLRRRIVLIAVIALAGAVISFFDGSWYDALAPYGLIACGCWVALLMHEPKWYAHLRHLGRSSVLAVLASLVLVVQLATGSITPGGDFYVAYGFLLAALLAGVVIHDGRGTDFLRSRPMVFLGKISFSFYLLHNLGINLAERLLGTSSFLMSVVSTTLGLAGVTAVCWLVHISFEQPLINVGHRLARRRKLGRELPAIAAARERRSSGDDKAQH